MISTKHEYEIALDEHKNLEERLIRLQTEAADSKDFTKAGVRKMIDRLCEELDMFEGSTKM